MVAQFAGFSSMLGGIHTTIGLIRKELEAAQAIRLQGVAQQLSVGTEMGKLQNMLPTDTDLSIGQLMKRAKNDKSGVPMAEILAMYNSAASSDVNAKMSERADIVDAVLRYYPYGDSEERNQLTSAALATYKIKEFGGTPGEHVAMHLQALGYSRQTSPGDWAKTGAPTIAKLAAIGSNKDDPRFLEALFAGVSLRAEDPTGRTTANSLMTSMTQLRSETEDIMPDASIEDRLNWMRGGSERANKTRAKILGPFADPEAMDAYEKSGGNLELLSMDMRARASHVIPVSEVFSPEDNLTKQMINTAREGMLGPTPEAVNFLEQRRQELNSQPEMVALQVQRAMDDFEQDLQSDPAEAIRGMIIEKMKTLDKRAGGSAVIGEYESLLMQLSDGGSLEEELGGFEGTVRGKAWRKRQPIVHQGPGGGMEAPSPRDIDISNRLSELADMLQTINETLMSNADRPQKVEVAGPERPGISPLGGLSE
ncbi:hypothetical protein [Blastopirellula marina]|nr:hypothetical protein [Blastopirellula marina]